MEKKLFKIRVREDVSLAIQFMNYLKPWPKVTLALYILAALIMGLSQGLAINLFSSNVSYLQGYLGVSLDQTLWINAAFYVSNITAIMILYKFRLLFGLKRFAELGLFLFLVCAGLQFLSDLEELTYLNRFLSGISTAPLNTLAVFYINERVKTRTQAITGLTLGMFGSQLAVPLSGILPWHIIETQYWSGVFIIDFIMALLCLMIIFFIPITPVPRENLFEKRDVLSYLSLMVFSSTLAIFFIREPVFYGDSNDTLDIYLIVSVMALIVLIANEFHRKNPILKIEWVFHPEMILFFCSLFFFRLILSETSLIIIPMITGSTVAGKADITVIYYAMAAGMIVGTAVVLLWMNEKNVILFQYLTLISSLWVLISDSQSGDYPGVENFIGSQFIMGLSSAIYIPSAIYYGFSRSVKYGKSQFMTFLLLFLGAQSIGSLIASAFINTMQKILKQRTLNSFGEYITPGIQRRILSARYQISADSTSTWVSNLSGLLAWHNCLIVLVGVTVVSMLILTLVQIYNRVKVK